MQDYLTFLGFVLMVVGVGSGPSFVSQVWEIISNLRNRISLKAPDLAPVNVRQENCENSETTIEIHNHYHKR